MIRIGILSIALSLTLNSCNGQVKTDTKKADNDTIKPQTNVKVNKEYDKDGNLVKYDSTYSAYYSNIQGDSLLADSILHNFKDYFNQKYNFSNQSYFNNLFFQDSLLPYDFYKNDFFFNRFRQNMTFMDKLFWEMDSIKNHFYQQQFLDDITRKEKDKKK